VTIGKPTGFHFLPKGGYLKHDHDLLLNCKLGLLQIP